ncbi:NAD(P)-dependent dehydrogenase, short-chain alcohol dehydrogenase family [Tistlia consotensis]|uniref:NAD(P)-dependent dehydrogenase, short-chain alcohol dehydrogenase family n=1 Tax=Tistlia consotensis USBA 355 TaxID=560819 RepID=A0A1Y6BFM8_9PROT|nr:SDR family oxidoreductase [Tistlia consotensis]SME98958.1 NAD(P)-dependent dehydrogenase, short-chain alcohol dehydrogenase family [Tistlia consotensis USBA 355]SNR77609.1 NAD(P)-dependent dehydrogenase, short-chain alcohol dehydrogenase family [Tistlia consotensis]
MSLPLLADHVVAVTGAARGVGAAVARACAAHGAALLLLDVEAIGLERLACELAESGTEALSRIVDVREAGAVAEAFAAAAERFGGLTTLIQSASPERRDRRSFPENMEHWHAELEILLEAPAQLAAAAAPLLSKAANPSILNISSVLGAQVAQQTPGYHIAKAGIDHLTRYLAVSLGESSIRVNAMALGLVDRDEGPRLTDDPINRAVCESVVPLRRAANGRDIGQAAVMLASPLASYVTGHVLVVDGGLSLNEPFFTARKGYLHGKGPVKEV